MQPELDRLEKEEKRKKTGAKLAFERIAKQRNLMSRTSLIAIIAVLFSVVSMAVIAFESSTTFSDLFAVPVEGSSADQAATAVVLVGIGVVAFFLLGLAGFGIYILVWSSKKKAALLKEEQAIRKDLDDFYRQKEILRQELGAE